MCIGARFNGAKMTYADLTHADVSAAEFKGARLFRTRLHGVKDAATRWDGKGLAVGDDADLAEAERFEAKR